MVVVAQLLLSFYTVGFSDKQTLEASSPTHISTAEESLKLETHLCVPWSLPSRGITEDLGLSFHPDYDIRTCNDKAYLYKSSKNFYMTKLKSFVGLKPSLVL